MNVEIKGKISIKQCKETMKNLNQKLNMKKKNANEERSSNNKVFFEQIIVETNKEVVFKKRKPFFHTKRFTCMNYVVNDNATKLVASYNTFQEKKNQQWQILCGIIVLNAIAERHK
jgi:hypothetical protein